MDLNIEQIKKYDITKLVELIKPITEELYLKFKFTELTKEEFDNLVKKEIIDAKKNYDGSIKFINYINRRLNIRLFNYAKEKINEEQNNERIINNYINKNFIVDNEYNTCINNLNKLSKFFDKYGYIYNVELLISLLNKNQILLQTTEIIINKYYDKIVSGKLNQIINNTFIISMIEAYCISKNIEIEETEEKEEEIINETDDMKLYFHEISRIPLLSVEEERKLAYKILENDEQARNKMIESNLRLVVSVAKNYQNKGLPFLDLIQEGNLGLIEAIDKFDVTLGYKFSTYAIWWIRQKISRAVANQGRNIRIPVHLYEKINAYRRMENKLKIETNREPTIPEVAEAMNITIEQAQKLSSLQTDTISLSTPLGDEKELTLEDTIPNPSETLEEKVLNQSLPEEVRKVLNKCNLTEKERDIIILRFGINGKKTVTLEEVGKKYNITRERARQIEAKALKKLRNSRYSKELSVYTYNQNRSLDKIEIYRKQYAIYRSEYKTYLKNEIIEEKDKEETIYDFFSDYTKDEVNKMLDKLSMQEKNLIYMKYGYDLNEPTAYKLPEQQSIYYYQSLLPKIQKILAFYKGKRKIKTLNNN